MKINLTSIILLLACWSLQAQYTVQWSDSLVVTATPIAITAPRITLLADGTPLLTWGVSSNPNQIWCSRLENDAFTTPVAVVQPPYVPSLFGFGGYDVAVSDSQVFVVFEQLAQGILLARSDDGGQTFYPPTSVQGAVSGGYATLASVIVDGSGNPVVSYILDQNGASYEVRRSSDGGISFNDPVIGNAAAPGGAVCECCTSDLLASGDSIWMVFRNNNQNLRDIWVSRSTDLAGSFDTATDVDATDWVLNACPISGPRMARSGDSLLLAWMSRASGVGRVHLSTLHAGTMQGGQQLEFLTQPQPQNVQSQADITASGDTIGLVLVEKSREIVGYFSTTGVSNLTSHSTRFAIPNHTLQLPSIAYRNGVFHFVYVDATSDQVLYRRGNWVQSSAAQEPLHTTTWISPNPSSGLIQVQTDGNPVIDLLITDVQGRHIQWKNNFRDNGKYLEIDLLPYPAGLYFLQLRTTGGWRGGRVFKY